MKDRSRLCRFFLFILILSSKKFVLSDTSVACRFDEQDDNIFWIGETITGFVDFVHKDSADLKLERIDGELIGETVTKVLEETENGNVERKVEEIIFNQKIFVGPLNTKGSFSVERGKHSWPFRFQLADDLPPSFEQNKTDVFKVHYYIRFSFVRSEWYRFNIHKTCPIVVRQPGRLLPLTKLKAEKSSRNGVRLRVMHDRNVVIAGHKLSFNANFINPKQALIRRVSIILTEYIEYDGREKSVDIIKQDLDYIKALKDKHIDRNFQILIPSTTPVTFTFADSTANHYKLRFEVHLRGIFTNIKLEIPIVVMDLVPDVNDNENDE
ncbi:unnamed protein product [Adineta ricciae]|uniref:Arrestin C-terminal-like domain-containing protein n=1 Tax=Adineta ricciae TaxID=249248 RepID=A0A815GZH7_ADIRI|nr:unnamed protein product [Adineta ricciae]